MQITFITECNDKTTDNMSNDLFESNVPHFSAVDTINTGDSDRLPSRSSRNNASINTKLPSEMCQNILQKIKTR